MTYHPSWQQQEHDAATREAEVVRAIRAAELALIDDVERRARFYKYDSMRCGPSNEDYAKAFREVAAEVRAKAAEGGAR